MKWCLYLLLISRLAMVSGASVATGQVRVNTIELPDADFGGSFILNIAKARIEGIPAGAKTEQEMLDAFRKAGDIVYDVDIRIASGRCVVLDRQRIAKLAGKTPSDVTEDRDVVQNVKQGDYLLVKRTDGGYAIILLKAVNRNKSITLSWVMNSGGDSPFIEEEIAAILEVSQLQRGTVVTGVSVIRSLSSSEPTVFSFEDGKAKPFPGRASDIRAREDYQKYGSLLSNVADLAYEVADGGAQSVLVLSRSSVVLGKGGLVDFADRDVSANVYGKRSLFQGADLAPGTVVAMQDRGGKYAMIRIESTSAKEIKFQWAYLPDGSSVFPRVDPLPDAVQAVPEVRDIKLETQSRLMRLVYQSAQMRDEDVRREFEKIVADGADVNMTSARNGANPLGRAAWVGSKHLVEILVASGAKIDESCALHSAAYSGRGDVCEFLLSKGADRSYRNKNGLTAFEVAKTSPQSNAVVLKMCWPEGGGGMTVHNAALLGESTFLRNLIANGADVNAYDDLTGKTPLALAGEAGHVEACKILVEAGADVEKGTQITKIFPMVLAVQAGQMSVVQYLCGKASDRQAAEAFYEAFLRKRPEIAGVIIEQSKDTSALYQNAREHIDSLLRAGDKGVYSLLRHKDVALPLWAAAGVGDTNVVKKAMEAGDDVDQVGSDFWGARGETPLLAAVVHGQYEAVRMLLAAGANPNRVLPRSGSSDTPLFSAVEAGDERLVDLLLKSKADVNATNNLGFTPLYLAVRKDRVSIVRALLESGADPNNIPALRSKDGKMSSLLNHTRDKGILQLLRNHGTR